MSRCVQDAAASVNQRAGYTAYVLNEGKLFVTDGVNPLFPYMK